MKGMLASNKTATLQECLICKEEKRQGIHLLEYFICKSCEQDIVTTDTDDQRYDDYLYQLRKIRDSLFQNKRSIH
ncbi:sigma factor G inhibitor Gin [Alteribacter populi]|uniref:sigma factor G inhibitor Gin n=1 Tax=Alteribacter populi TaxID=2011011 RepID=UPI001E2F8D80|nr:sigma factor G inhibitor Gin [Alteribacter populi]